ILLFKIALCKYILSYDGYELWLQYEYINNESSRQDILSSIEKLVPFGNSETINIAFTELKTGLSSMLGSEFLSSSKDNAKGILIFGTKANLPEDVILQLGNAFNEINDEGYILKSYALKGKNHIVISGNTDVGVLYGVYNFLKLLQTNKSIEKLNTKESPKIKARI